MCCFSNALTNHFLVHRPVGPYIRLLNVKGSWGYGFTIATGRSHLEGREKHHMASTERLCTLDIANLCGLPKTKYQMGIFLVFGKLLNISVSKEPEQLFNLTLCLYFLHKPYSCSKLQYNLLNMLCVLLESFCFGQTYWM